MDSDRKQLLALKSLKPYILEHRFRIEVFFFERRKKNK